MGMIGNYIAVDEAKLEAIIKCEEDILDIDPKDCAVLDIDKSWQAIQYLLFRDIDEGPPPMGYVVPMMTDNAIDCELDFGAFYLTSEQVEEAYDYLNGLDEETIKDMYDFQAMVADEVYPIATDDDEDEFYQYIYSYLMDIKEFYKEAADKGKAVIFYVM